MFRKKSPKIVIGELWHHRSCEKWCEDMNPVRATAIGYGELALFAIEHSRFGLDANKAFGHGKATRPSDAEMDAASSDVDTRLRKSDHVVAASVEEAMRMMENLQLNGVTVVRSEGEIPQGHKALEALRSGAKVTGWYDTKTGKVYLYAPNIRSVEDLERTMRHENIHLGVREMLGRERFDALCDKVWLELMTPDERKSRMAYVMEISVEDFERLSPMEQSEAMADKSRQRSAADEFIAFFGENGSHMDVGRWERLVSWVRDILCRMGLKLELTADDLRRLLRRSEEAKSVGTKLRMGGDKQLQRVNGTFNSELQQQVEGKLPKDHVYQLGNPSVILQSAGVEDLPIELSAQRLSDKASENYKNDHPFDIADIRNLPRAINEPIAVFDSKTRRGVKVDLTELQSKGNNFVVALEVRKSADRNSLQVEVNSIRSLYPKGSKNGIIHWINSGLMRVVDKAKIKNFLSTQWPNYIAGKEKVASEISEKYPEIERATKIIENFENPKLSNENGSGSDTRFRFIGEKEAERLDKAEEATMRLDNLGVARQMEKAEKEARDIKLATGWERGADGKWRYETGDFAINEAMFIGSESQHMEQRYKELKAEDKTLQNKKERLWREYDLLPKRGRNDEQQKRAKEINKAVKEIIKQQNNVADEMRKLENEYRNYERGRVKLSELISNDNGLFDAYPKLRDLPVSIQKMPRGMRGSEHSDGQGNVVLIRLNQDMSTAEVRETLVHEIQHAIQDIEGFARGGDPIALKDAAGENLRNTRRELERVANDAGYSLSEVKKPDFATDNAELKAAIEQYNKASDVYFGADFYERYHNLGGEVEARNASNRIDMSDEQRRESLATDTEDVAREDQIFLMDNLDKSAMESKVLPEAGEQQADADALNRRSVDATRGGGDRAAVMERAAAQIARRYGVRVVCDYSLDALGEVNRADGTIRVNPALHTSAADMERTIIHEAVGHLGLEGVLGKDFDATCAKAAALMDSESQGWLSRQYGDEWKRMNAATRVCAEHVSALEIDQFG